MMYAIILAVALLGTNPTYNGLVYVRSADCPVCESMSPTIQKLLIEGKPIIIITVKTAAELEVYNVKHVPATLAYKRGKVIHKTEGLLSITELRQWIHDIEDR